MEITNISFSSNAIPAVFALLFLKISDISTNLPALYA